MDYRTAEIAQHFRRWIARYSPPQHVKDKPEIMQDEIDAMMTALLRRTPRVDYMPFVHQVLDRLDFTSKTRVWPTVFEISTACSAIGRESPVAIDVGQKPDPELGPLRAAASRIKAGEAVQDFYLYGPKALRLVREGHVTEGDLNRYREAMRSAFERVWGVEPAGRAIAEYESYHRDQHVRAAE